MSKYKPPNEEVRETMAKSILTRREKEVFEIYKKRHLANQHKMKPIPICLISENLKSN